jgi:hypothetical protein
MLTVLVDCAINGLKRKAATLWRLRDGLPGAV